MFGEGKFMEKYLNLSGDSGVLEYEVGPEFIVLRFKRNSTRYLYDHFSAGKNRILDMIRLARSGQGLATYVARHVKGMYARKY